MIRLAPFAHPPTDFLPCFLIVISLTEDLDQSVTCAESTRREVDVATLVPVSSNQQVDSVKERSVQLLTCLEEDLYKVLRLCRVQGFGVSL